MITFFFLMERLKEIDELTRTDSNLREEEEEEEEEEQEPEDLSKPTERNSTLSLSVPSAPQPGHSDAAISF